MKTETPKHTKGKFQAKIDFRFSFGNKENPTSMECAYIGEGEVKDGAIQNAWIKMSEDLFKRNIILNTHSIHILSTLVSKI